MGSQALGLIETFGYIGAVEAADICLKAANVKLTGFEPVTGGLVAVEFMGDVGAVKASIEAASSAVGKVGRLVSVHVIPRPAVETSKLLAGGLINAAGTLSRTGVSSEADREDTEEVMKGSTLTLICQEELNSMKVVELRALARKLEGIKLERKHIKYATRKELLEAILEYHERK